jgi:hypothetical protein
MKVFALAFLAALVLAPAALAKDGVKAKLVSPLPMDAQPGTTLDVSWSLASPTGPFDAMLIFVRVLDAGGGQPTFALADGSAHPGGRFHATVPVPPGGIGGIQFGVRGTTDVVFPLRNDPFAFRRPLHLPKLARGAACPVSTPDAGVDFSAYGVARGLGTGPAYPVGMASGTLNVGPAVNFGSKVWGGQKVLWFVVPSYTGPVLIRGGRLDAKGDVRFEVGNVPPKELLLPASKGARDRASYTRLEAPGCYAYQVDGTSFSTIVVFRATGP